MKKKQKVLGVSSCNLVFWIAFCRKSYKIKPSLFKSLSCNSGFMKEKKRYFNFVWLYKVVLFITLNWKLLTLLIFWKWRKFVFIWEIGTHQILDLWDECLLLLRLETLCWPEFPSYWLLVNFIYWGINVKRAFVDEMCSFSTIDVKSHFSGFQIWGKFFYFSFSMIILDMFLIFF